MAPTKSSTKTVPAISAVSQQSRFHTETLDTTLEVDLHDVTITVAGTRELISDAHLRLKNGVRYALVGRNGMGKSTLLQAIADIIIPGLPPSLRVLLVSQVTDSARATDEDSTLPVLEHVVQGDKERTELTRQFNALTTAVNSDSLAETQNIVSTLVLERLQRELVDAQKVASRTSGTRGKKARGEEIKAEEGVKEAEEALAAGTLDLEVASRASDMLTDVTTTLELVDASTTESRAASILSGLGFSQEMMDAPYTSLSGGWRSRCALATSLLIQSDVLILDEPSNFMDLEVTLWLEQYLIEQERTIILTSHDQVFLNHVVDDTIILRNQKLKYFEGTPRAFELNERKERKTAVKSKEILDKKKEHIEGSIRAGMASAKQTGDDNRLKMVKSRQKKLDERWGVETSAKGGRFKLNRDLAGYHLTARAGPDIEAAETPIRITIPDPEKLRTLGDLVHFDNVTFHYPKTSAALLENVSFTVDQGGRCAFVGANGHGKSTLAKLVLGELVPTKGTVTRHPLLKIGYFSQHSVEELSREDDATALGYFMDHFKKLGDDVKEDEARRCLGSFGLGGKIASDTALKSLSGGQKVRLAFALIVYRAPSLLLLDELTTHVDAPTIQAIALALKRFSGGIILVTHDRWFSRVVVEGCSLSSAGAFDDDEEDDEDTSGDDDDNDGSKKPGQTFHVGRGKIKLLEKGMSQYVGMVERKLEKKRKAALVHKT